MLSKVIAAAILTASVSAHAVESEFFFQSKAGQSDITAKLGLLSAELKNNGFSTKYTGIIDTGVAYEYGINDQFAIEGTLFFSSIENDATPKDKESGLQDPTVTLKGTSVLGASNLRYGLSVNLALQKATVNGNDSNVAKGGYSFVPYLGMDTEALGGTMGARLNYTIRLERTIEVSGQTPDSKIKEGNGIGLSAFYETKVTDVTLGGSINLEDVKKTKDENDADLTAAYTKLGVSVYSVLPFGEWSLIPRLDYDFHRSSINTYNFAVVSVAGRLSF